MNLSAFVLRRPWIAVAALMIVLAVLRVFPGWFYLVQPDQEPRLPDPDAYYHFRQAAYTVQNFPHLLRSDDVSFYPSVASNEATGLYDLTLAALAKLVALSGMAPLRALWWVCLWFPPLCATAIMPFVFVLVRRQGTAALGLGMALWYILLPGGTLTHMTLGICDHHVVEMLLSVLCIFLLHRLVVDERERPSAWWRPAWAAALPLAILQFTWVGGPLFLPLFGVAGLGQLAADVLAGAGARPMVRAGVRYWLAFFVLTAGAGVLLPSLVLLSDLWKETLAGTAGVLAALPAAAWFFETPRLRFRPAVRLALGAGALTLLAALVHAVSPFVRDLMGAGLGQKSTLVAENHPVSLAYYWSITGLAGVIGPFAPLMGIAFGAWRRPAWWIPVLPSLFFVALWCHTYDYVYQGALHAILLTGYFFGAALFGRIASRRESPQGSALRGPPQPGEARSAARFFGPRSWAICTLAVVLCCWPAHWTVPWWLPGTWYENDAELPSNGWIEAMKWLRTETPAPPSSPAPGELPLGRVGVLTDWNTGQFVNTLAGRPATNSRYPNSQGIAPFFLETEEAVRAAPLHGSTVAAAVRYVVLDPITIGDNCGGHLLAIGSKLESYNGRGTFVDGSGHIMSVPTLGASYDAAFATRLLLKDGEGLSHFRLIFESRELSLLRLTYDAKSRQLLPKSTVVRTEAMRAAAVELLRAGLWKERGADAYLGHLLANVKIFEQVAGARVEGRAPAGSTVTFDLPLRLRTSGREWHYRQSTQADRAGSFHLIEPYSTERTSGSDLEPAGKAQLSVERTPADASRPIQTASLLIPESAIQSGGGVAWEGRLGTL